MCLLHLHPHLCSHLHHHKARRWYDDSGCDSSSRGRLLHHDLELRRTCQARLPNGGETILVAGNATHGIRIVQQGEKSHPHHTPVLVGTRPCCADHCHCNHGRLQEGHLPRQRQRPAGRGSASAPLIPSCRDHPINSSLRASSPHPEFPPTHL